MSSKDKPKRNHLALIVDRSGSMGGKESDVIGGVNKFIEEHMKTGIPATVTVMKFDHEFELETSDLAGFKTWGPSDYVPRGSTALLDAVGRTLTHLGPLVAKDDPENVIVVIITDGYENHSTEYKKPRIKQLIEHCQLHGWAFLYLGAGVDAFSEAAGMGIAANTTTQYTPTNAGTQSAYANMTATSVNLTTGAVTAQFVDLSKSQKEEDKKRGVKSWPAPSASGSTTTP